MQFSGKFGVFTPPLEGSRPPSGKSWIRHWVGTQPMIRVLYRIPDCNVLLEKTEGPQCSKFSSLRTFPPRRIRQQPRYVTQLMYLMFSCARTSVWTFCTRNPQPRDNAHHHVLPYRSGTVNSNTVNSKFHLIRSFFEILARILSFHVENAQLIQTRLIQSSTNSKGI